MKTDLYTKTILTIIAICLVIIVLKQSHPFPSAFAGEKEYNNNGVDYSILPVNSNGTIDVNIVSSYKTLDVNISKISTSDELDVNIDEVGGTWISNPLTVKVDN